MKYRYSREDLNFESFDMGNLIDNSKDSIFNLIDGQKRLIDLAEKLDKFKVFEAAALSVLGAFAYNLFNGSDITTHYNLVAFASILFCDANSRILLNSAIKSNSKKIRDWKEYSSGNEGEPSAYTEVNPEENNFEQEN
jgi:hypothetical protein